jgi:hypothetical protein
MRAVGVGVLGLVAACGNHAAVDPADAPSPPPIDAPAPDMGPCFKNYDPQDQGEVRVALVHHADGTIAARAGAFVYADRGAGAVAWADQNGCQDVSGHDHAPFAIYPAATYHDPGDVLISGGPQPLQLARQTAAGADVLGRTHPANAWFAHDAGPAADDGAQYLTPDTQLTVTLTGSATFPSHVYDNKLYLPPTSELVSPGMEPLVISSSASSLTFERTVPAADDPPQPVLSWLTFNGPDGPIAACAEPLDGTLTVPAAIVDLVRTKAPDGGTLVRETSVTDLGELDDGTGEHVDANGCPLYPTIFLVGANRYESAFTVEP